MLALVLQGCASSPAVRAVADIGRAWAPFAAKPGAVPPVLNPNYKYLRLEFSRHVAYFARGYEDVGPAGATEVWYSGLGEVLRLRNGRPVGATGMGIDWTSVTYSGAGIWPEGGAVVHLTRSRDQSPGYAFGITEILRLRRIDVPRDVRLWGADPASLLWYEEVVERGSDLPPVRYGVRPPSEGGEVHYSEICLSVDYCFSWQRWTPS